MPNLTRTGVFIRRDPVNNDGAHFGFTLTEMAIVLGVMGLILSGIWTGYRTAMQNYTDRKGWTDILTIMNNLRILYLQNPNTFGANFSGAASGCNNSYVVSSTPTTPGGSPPADAGQTAYYNQTYGASPSSDLVALSVFPGDMLMTSGGTKYPVSPWGGGVGSFTIAAYMTNGSCNGASGTTNSSSGAMNQSDFLSFTFENMTVAQCIDTLYPHVAEWLSYGINQVCIGANNGLCTSGQYFGGVSVAKASMTLPNISYWCSLNNSLGANDKVSLTANLSWPAPY